MISQAAPLTEPTTEDVKRLHRNPPVERPMLDGAVRVETALGASVLRYALAVALDAALDDDADAGMSRIDEATRSAARSFLTKAFDTAFDEQPEPDADEIDDEARD